MSVYETTKVQEYFSDSYKSVIFSKNNEFYYLVLDGDEYEISRLPEKEERIDNILYYLVGSIERTKIHDVPTV